VLKPLELTSRALSSSDETVRVMAVEALSILGGADAIAALLSSLSDGGVYVPWRAGDALVRIGGDDVAAGLIERLEDPRTEVRRCALFALGHLDHPRAEETILALLEQDGIAADVRQSAVGGLWDRTSKAARAASIRSLRDRDPKVRFMAAAVLRGAADDAEVDGLIEALWDEDELACIRAAGSLLPVSRARVTEAFASRLAVELAVESSSGVARALVIALLSADESEESVAALSRHAKNWRNPMLSSEAIQALIRMREGRGQQAVLALLEADEPDGRQERAKSMIVHELGMAECQWAAAALIDLLESHQLTQVQESAAYALGRIGGEPSLAALRRAASSVLGNIRGSVASALGTQRDVRALQPLTLLLHDVLSSVRRSAAVSMGRIGGVRALDLLVRAMLAPPEPKPGWHRLS
jgi:HEAT repeat protein